MQYCKNCGTELADDAAFCAKCGTSTAVPNDRPVQPAQPQPAQQAQPQSAQNQSYSYYNGNQAAYQKTNTMSVVGFVLSLLGFNLVSLILSIVGLSQVKKSQMTQMPESGKGLAIAGIVISSLTIVALIIYVIIVAIYASSYYYYY